MAADTAWFRACKWGVFTHYLAQQASGGPATITVDEWNRRVDGFDVAGLLSQLLEIGAKYHFITVGQNSGFFCSPNGTYDRLVDRTPSRLSQRDLVAEIAEALQKAGIRTMVYLPSHAPAHDRLAVEGLACTPNWDASNWQLRPGTYLNAGETDARLSGFQRNWETIVKEWSLRWGRTVHGWWIDGCYYSEKMYRSDDPPNFESFAAALRAGNRDSLVAFNAGIKVPVVSLTEHEDFTAGEVAGALPVTADPWNRHPPRNGKVGGAQYHILTFLGKYWGRGAPRISKELAAAYTRHVCRQGGVITWDVPIESGGLIPRQFVEQLAFLGASV